MVTINLTLLIELGLFLIFMWAMKTYVFWPLLKVMDSRDAQLEDDRTVALTDAEAAETLEVKYRSELAEIHHAASRNLVRAHREAQVAHLAEVDALKAEGEAALSVVRQETSETVEAQREHYPELVDVMAEAMDAKLHGEGR